MPLHCSFFCACIIEYATAVGIEVSLVVKAKDFITYGGGGYALQMSGSHINCYVYVIIVNLLLCAMQISNNFRTRPDNGKHDQITQF